MERDIHFWRGINPKYIRDSQEMIVFHDVIFMFKATKGKILNRLNPTFLAVFDVCYDDQK